MDGLFEVGLGQEKKGILLVNAPNVELSGEFEVVFDSGYFPGEFYDLFDDVDKLMVEYLLNIINECNSFGLLGHIDHK